MKINLATWDRILRYALGFLLCIWVFAGGAAWGYIGVYLLATAAWGIDPIYVYFRVRTATFSDVPFSEFEDEEKVD